MKTRLWSLARHYWFDALILVGLGLGLAIAVVTQGRKGDSGPRGPLWFDVLALLAVFLPLFARRLFPFGAPAATLASASVSSFIDETLMPAVFVTLIAGCAAFYLLGLLRERSQALTGLALGLVLVSGVPHNDPSGGAGNYIWEGMFFVVAWTLGFSLGRKLWEAVDARERADRAEREREDQARLAVAEERARIARELHDVVGHAVSVMTVQASGVRRLLKPEQEREREALLVVEQTGRDALAEMRRMVGVLRSLDEAPALAPQPSLGEVDKLVEQARNAGLPVELRIEGEPVELPAGVDLTAYRIVQEGLTNATKHSRAEHAEVLVRYDNGHVEVTISDDGQGGGGGIGESGGHGLVGMRERVSVYGGELEVGPRPEGGFALRVRLPIA
jgi:signal transduction histidine kinase